MEILPSIPRFRETFSFAKTSCFMNKVELQNEAFFQRPLDGWNQFIIQFRWPEVWSLEWRWGVSTEVFLELCVQKFLAILMLSTIFVLRNPFSYSHLSPCSSLVFLPLVSDCVCVYTVYKKRDNSRCNDEPKSRDHFLLTACPSRSSILHHIHRKTRQNPCQPLDS